MLHGIIRMSRIICCEDFVISLIDRSSFLSVKNMIFFVASSSHIFLFVTGTIGIVDYTNYDDMKYAVSPYGIAWSMCVNHFILQLFSCSLLFDFCNT
jgi:hypothetical protein